MCRLLLLSVLVPALAACAPLFQPQDAVEVYEQHILDWQHRIRLDGWSKGVVDDIVRRCAWVMRYENEEGDHWATPREIKEAGMRGDCEDFAVLMMATLKRLDYPHRVRLQAVRVWYGLDHAMLLVEGQGGEWWRYNPVPTLGDGLDLAGCVALFEWDEGHVWEPGHR